MQGYNGGMMGSKKNAIALSLFSGIGGFEVGMARCGFSFVKTLEWDDKCCETLSANKEILGSAEESISPIDITKMPPEEFYDKPIDYIVGGPPCQSFSAAGRRAGGVAGTTDARGELFKYYCDYVQHFKPKAFVFENVRGILSANKGADFKSILEAFTEVGYTLYWKILNAADYGAPQLRERVFLVGIRNDLGIEFKFPLPTHGPDSPGKKPYVTVIDAIGAIQDENEVVPPYGGKYGDLIPDIPPGENYRYYTEEMGHPNPLFAWRSKFSNFLYKMDPNDVCRTIIAYQGRYDGPFHWKNRKCTVEELKLMQGFPLDFIINQPYAEGVKQVGNSVCPLVAEQIGKALRYQIEGDETYKIPLIEAGQTLSFDKRKHLRAKKSKEKIVVKYSGISGDQSDLDDFSDTSYDNFIKSFVRDNYEVKWIFNDGRLIVDFGRPTDKMLAKLSLSFIGGVKKIMKSITVKCYADTWDDSLIRYLWNEAHLAVNELSSFDSLLPLYGHFTEPYPKFSIKFESEIESKAIIIQKMALDPEILNKVVSYDLIKSLDSSPSEFIKKMRTLGFDIRSNNTNRTIPAGHFRICYPFTMPIDWKSYVVWKDD